MGLRRTGTPAIGVLLSGSGRTLQNLLDRIADSSLDAEIRCVISDRDGVKGLTRAAAAGLPTLVTRDPDHIYRTLREHDCNLVCLCGYLRLLPIPADYRGHVLNIHPALLPKHGGKGCYGDRVHAAVLAAGDAESGCTVHECSGVYDQGLNLVQKVVPVLPDDDVDRLAARVFAAECEAYPEAIRRWGEASWIQHSRDWWASQPPDPAG